MDADLLFNSIVVSLQSSVLTFVSDIDIYDERTILFSFENGNKLGDGNAFTFNLDTNEVHNLRTGDSVVINSPSWNDGLNLDYLVDTYISLIIDCIYKPNGYISLLLNRILATTDTLFDLKLLADKDELFSKNDSVLNKNIIATFYDDSVLNEFVYGILVEFKDLDSKIKLGVGDLNNSEYFYVYSLDFIINDATKFYNTLEEFASQIKHLRRYPDAYGDYYCADLYNFSYMYEQDNLDYYSNLLKDVCDERRQKAYPDYVKYKNIEEDLLTNMCNNLAVSNTPFPSKEEIEYDYCLACYSVAMSNLNCRHDTFGEYDDDILNMDINDFLRSDFIPSELAMKLRFNPLVQNKVSQAFIKTKEMLNLSYNNKIIGYRFITDSGVFDISYDAAVRTEKYLVRKYLKNNKEKTVELVKRNGLLGTMSEFDSNNLILDVSNKDSVCSSLIESYVSTVINR